MTLRSAPPLKLSSIFTEFGAVAGTPFSEFLKGGGYVTSGVAADIPSSLPLSMSDFYGATAEPHITFVSASASAGTLTTTIASNSRDVRLDWTHATASSSGSISSSAIITLRYRLGNPPAANTLYISCGADYFDTIYKSYAGYIAMAKPSFASVTSITQSTDAVLQESTDGSKTANLNAILSELSIESAMTNRTNDAVPLALNPVSGFEFDIHISVEHSYSSPTVSTHQGTGGVVFAPSFLLMTGVSINQELQPQIDLRCAGALTSGA